MTRLNSFFKLSPALLLLKFNINMKSIIGMLASGFFFLTINAHPVTPNDSINTHSNNSEMVYYQLSTGNKTTVSNTDWHLAVSIRPTQFPASPLGGTTIRLNEADGVHAYYVPNADAAAFNNLDTTGWQSWTQLHDSDTKIDEGALNSNRASTNIFDFGWGTYNSINHNVTGDSLYLIELPNGGVKKLLVVNLDKDTAFNIMYANIDNSDLQNVHIGKAAYSGKQFVYMDMINDVVRDKEPLAANWDLQFLKYAATDVIPDTVYPVVGVWVNKGTQVGKAESADVSSNYFGGTYTTDLNGIGWNWKQYDNQNNAYTITDSLAYFIQALDGHEYKVVFTGYSGSATGIISFYKEEVLTSGITETANNIKFAVYPNPANNLVNVATDADNNTSITLTDLSGRVLVQQKATAFVTQINTGNFAKGIYLVTVSTNGSNATQKVVIN